ncbi:MAG: hypothetical protein CMF64_03285 [Magnetovibrio sp.]|nr:hypothetical protein [Magnetovibrio sp.]
MKSTVFAAALIALTVPAVQAGTLENLERERALLIEVFRDAGLSLAERQSRIESTMPRLIDLERMVLRDDSLKGRNTPAVRKAFANYDLTFLAHASAEHRRTALDTWLEQIGMTTAALTSARIGRRY